MNVVDIVRVLVDETLGNAGAVRNCRSELVRRSDAERQIDALCHRMPSVQPTTPGIPECSAPEQGLPESATA